MLFFLCMDYVGGVNMSLRTANKRLGGEPRPWRWNLAKETTYPLGGLGSRSSAAGAIPSGRDEETRGRRSPSFSSSNSRRSVINDGRQSSAAMSLTSILRRKKSDSATACSRVRARVEMVRRQMRERRRKAEEAMARRPKDIYRRLASNG